jgi:hypothetical protein
MTKKEGPEIMLHLETMGTFIATSKDNLTFHLKDSKIEKKVAEAFAQKISVECATLGFERCAVIGMSDGSSWFSSLGSHSPSLRDLLKDKLNGSPRQVIQVSESMLNNLRRIFLILLSRSH